MKLTKELVRQIREDHGEAFYLLDTKQFRENYIELKEAFAKRYPNFNIAYSYKTNYTPVLCKIVNELGGYAEVVSEMEAALAVKIGVKPDRIIWNGPIKSLTGLEEYLLLGVMVNLDNEEEIEDIKEIIKRHTNNSFNLGIRCNYEVGDGEISRFGFDIQSEGFKRGLDYLVNEPRINFINFQCHFAKRQMEFWTARVLGMIELCDSTGVIPKRIDLGGGILGKMPDELKVQFSFPVPNYDIYAQIVTDEFNKKFAGKENAPEIIIEPGSALVGDCMTFVGTVKSIKNIRGKDIATIIGSQENISMTGVNPPIDVFDMGGNDKEYTNLDMAGYTCIESDYLYRGYSGKLSVGDAVVFGNCGSYSLVMKPPFILPNFPVLAISGDSIEVIKRNETFEDIFRTFNHIGDDK